MFVKFENNKSSVTMLTMPEGFDSTGFEQCSDDLNGLRLIKVGSTIRAMTEAEIAEERAELASKNQVSA